MPRASIKYEFRVVFSKPQVAVRTRHNTLGISAMGGNREFPNDASWRDSTDGVASSVGEPHIPVSAFGDQDRIMGPGWKTKLSDAARGCDAADLGTICKP